MKLPKGWEEWFIAAWFAVLALCAAALIAVAVMTDGDFCPRGKTLTAIAGGKLGLACL